jgi:hypothetical protein|tara:strand:+ start:153 stop:335 length:183 start_codon:yes stop_codon:yes gene_type:complete
MNRFPILWEILKYLRNVTLVLFLLAVLGVSISMIEEYRMHKFIENTNERIKENGKMDSSH